MEWYEWILGIFAGILVFAMTGGIVSIAFAAVKAFIGVKAEAAGIRAELAGMRSDVRAMGDKMTDGFNRAEQRFDDHELRLRQIEHAANNDDHYNDRRSEGR